MSMSVGKEKKKDFLFINQVIVKIVDTKYFKHWPDTGIIHGNLVIMIDNDYFFYQIFWGTMPLEMTLKFIQDCLQSMFLLTIWNDWYYQVGFDFC